MAYENEIEDKSAKSVAPPWLNTPQKRRKLGAELAEMCEASVRQIGRLVSRWQEVDEASVGKYRETLRRPWPTAPVYHFPVVRPKLMQGTDFVANPLTQSDPLVIVKAGGPAGKRAYPVERALHLFHARAQYSEMVRYAMDVIQRRGKCYIRPTYNKYTSQGGRNVWPSVTFDVFSPEHMRTYPAYANTVDEMIFIGHEYDAPLKDIQAKQKSGFFFADVKSVGGRGPDEWNERLLQDRSENEVKPEHSAVQCVEGFVKFDEDPEQRWWKVQLDPDSEHILRVSEYPHRKPWYIDCAIHLEYMRSLYENSRGSDLLGPQYYSNDMRNMTTWLALWNGMSPMFAQNGALPDDIQSAQPGMVYPLQYGGQMFTPQGRVDMQGLVELIQLAQNDSDFASGMSAQAGGASSRTRPTATEVMRIGQGQDAAVSGDMVHAGFGLSRLAEFTCCDLMYTYFDDWYAPFTDMLPKLSQEDFDRPYWFEANGQSPSMPALVFQQVNDMIGQLRGLVQIMPELTIRYPDLVPGLLRTGLEQINAAMKDTMMPDEEEDEKPITDMPGAGITGANGVGGMGLSALAMGAAPPTPNGAF